LVDDAAQENLQWVHSRRTEDPDQGEGRRRETSGSKQVEERPRSNERRDVGGRDHHGDHGAGQQGADVHDLGTREPDEDRRDEREGEYGEHGRGQAACAAGVDERDDPGDRGHGHHGSN